MWVQLTTLAFLLLVTGGASAEEVASLSGFVYADSDGTLVSAPQASVSAGISEGVTLNAKFTVDTVTAASRVIDGISSATPEVEGALKSHTTAKLRTVIDTMLCGPMHLAVLSDI